MNRRNFLKKSSLSIPLSLSGFGLTAGSKEWSWLREVDSNNENILVLIQLNGGNDGLSTFVPINQYSNLFKARENIIIPESDLLSIDRIDDMKFHPGLSEMKTLFEEKKMGILQNVGYPNPNKSHFRSTDIWTSASDAGVIDNTGWLGRFLSNDYPEYPEGFPNENVPAPLAMTIDSLVSTTCQGSDVNLSFAISKLESAKALISDAGDTIPDNSHGDELKFIIRSIEQSNAYGAVISEAAEKGNNLSEKYSTTTLSKQLKIVANLISGGLGTKIYVVKLGGFDTHDAQVDQNNVLAGRHADLMANLSQSIGAFMDDLSLLGKSEKVVTMTFSEFGRRTNSNGSYGTDHGEAAPLMLFGDQVIPMIHGENPEIPDDTDGGHNLPMKIDFRSVYGSMLIDLFGVSETLARQVVDPNFQYIQLLNGNAVLSSENMKNVKLEQNFPNPVKDYTTIKFKTRGLPVTLDIFSIDGKTTKVLIQKHLQQGLHEIKVDLSDLPNGYYTYRLREGTVSTSNKLKKI